MLLYFLSYKHSSQTCPKIFDDIQQRWGTFLPLEAALELGRLNFLYFTVGIFIYLSI